MKSGPAPSLGGCPNGAGQTERIRHSSNPYLILDVASCGWMIAERKRGSGVLWPAGRCPSLPAVPRVARRRPRGGQMSSGGTHRRNNVISQSWRERHWQVKTALKCSVNGSSEWLKTAMSSIDHLISSDLRSSSPRHSGSALISTSRGRSAQRKRGALDNGSAQPRRDWT